MNDAHSHYLLKTYLTIPSSIGEWNIR